MLEAVEERGSALVVHGDPGIGKSALLAVAARRASERGMRVLTATGVQSESELPFAGLHQLLRPVLGDLDRLPLGLQAAFGAADDAPPAFFRTALGALDLLADSAAQTPVLLIAEDAHWLDDATCDVLAFVARRLESDPIVLVVATREVASSRLLGIGLPELHVGGLDLAASGELLDLRSPGLAAPMRERLLADAAGNPLALVELPIAMKELADGSLPAWLPLTGQLEKVFASRVSELPADTRALLLVAALNDSDSLAEILPAGALFAGSSVTTAGLVPAIDAGLVSVNDDRYRFRHPLVRSAINQSASLPDRHAAHAALADVLVPQPDRRIWHLAASTLGPAEEIADELEAAAARAASRGALASAAAALERSARLTEDPRHQERRLLRAGELALELGQREMVVRLVHEVEDHDLSAIDLGRKAWILETFDPDISGDPPTVLALVDAADRVREQGDNDLALQLLWAAASNGFWANRSDETHDEIAAASDRVPVADDDARLLSILSYIAPIEGVAEMVERISARAPDRTVDPTAMQLLGNAAFALNAHAQAAGFLTASIDAMREQGRLNQLAQSLVMRGWSEVHLGHWDIAASDAQEASTLAKETAQPIWEAGAQVVQALLAAVHGEEETALSLAAAADEVVLPARGRAVIAVVQLTRGVAALGAGRNEEAFEHLRRMLDPAELSHHRMTNHWALVGLCEAAVQTGRADEARAELHKLERNAAHMPSPLFHQALRHARALLASDADAERSYSDALALNENAPPFERARLQLAYGIWLRRQRRASDARAPLRAARDAFDALGAMPWGERARQELRASGESSGRRSPDARDELTPQELQIAQMAADGLSNREIGQKLYLSHRTIGFHLYRVFPKLGIKSRAELGRALSASTDA